MITVNTDVICAAIEDIFDDTRLIAEPAGALNSIPFMPEYNRSNNLYAIVGRRELNFNSSLDWAALIKGSFDWQ